MSFTPKIEAWRALQVITQDSEIRRFLEANDPKALTQAKEAIWAIAADMSDAERVFIYPSGTKLSFKANGSPFVRGMVRDLPGIPRRITNLDSGSEFFVNLDTKGFRTKDVDLVDTPTDDDPFRR